MKIFKLDKNLTQEELDDVIEALNANIEVMELDINDGIMDKQQLYKEKNKKTNLEEFVMYLTDLRSPEGDEEED
jgi:aconitase B